MPYVERNANGTVRAQYACPQPDMAEEWLDDGHPDLAPQPVIPSTVTMRQARLALLQSGLLSQVNSAVAAADEATKITWDYSSEVHRNHPFVAALAAALNLTEAQLDGLFTLAASL